MGNGALFYTVEEADGDELAQFAVFRQDIQGGDPQRLFEFQARGSRRGQAASSPEGDRIAYADTTGLRLRNLLTGEDTPLSANSADDCSTSTLCYRNSSPIWSPDGELIAFLRIYYEGSALLVASASGAEPEKQVTVGGFAFRSWSPDGTQLCSNGAYLGPAAVYDLASKTQTSLDRLVSREAVLTGCAWSPAGDQAIAYEIPRPGPTPRPDTPADPGSGRFTPSVVFLDSQGSIAASYQLPHSSSLPAVSGLYWPDDSSGLIVDLSGRLIFVSPTGSIVDLGMEGSVVLGVLPR